MNVRAIKSLKRKLAAGQPTYGMWITLESPAVSMVGAALGLDWIVIEGEHGHLGMKELFEHLRSTVRSDTVVLTRISELSRALIKKVLDVGVDGVIIPFIESADELQRAVRFAQYPPMGIRGLGGESATCWGQCVAEHIIEAREHTLVIPLIETVTAGKNIEQLCAVEGVDIFFLGPSDYSSTAGYTGEWEGPGIAAELIEIKDTVRRHGKHCGIIGRGTEDLLRRRDAGFRMLCFGADVGILIKGLKESLQAVGRDSAFATDLVPREPNLKQIQEEVE